MTQRPTGTRREAWFRLLDPSDGRLLYEGTLSPQDGRWPDSTTLALTGVPASAGEATRRLAAMRADGTFPVVEVLWPVGNPAVQPSVYDALLYDELLTARPVSPPAGVPFTYRHLAPSGPHMLEAAAARAMSPARLWEDYVAGYALLAAPDGGWPVGGDPFAVALRVRSACPFVPARYVVGAWLATPLSRTESVRLGVRRLRVDPGWQAVWRAMVGGALVVDAPGRHG